MDARGVDLRGTKLVDIDLTGAVFDFCNLAEVYIEECNLTNALFRGANLRGMSLGGCNLKNANFKNATINGILCVEHHGSAGTPDLKLSESQFMSTASYKKKSLDDCVIYGDPTSPPAYDFSDASLSRVTLKGDLTKCEFRGAKIGSVRFHGKLHFGQLGKIGPFKYKPFFRSGKLAGSFVGKADLSFADLRNAEISCRDNTIDYSNAMISGCQIFGWAMDAKQLQSTRNFKEGNLTCIVFRRMDLSDVDFSHQNLTASSFYSCDLSNAKFENAVITRTVFGSQMEITIEQLRSTWNFKQNRMATVKLPESIRDELEKEAKE